MKYRKKPVVIEAWQWDGISPNGHWPAWLRDYNHDSSAVFWDKADSSLVIPTLEGLMRAAPNDWIIQGVKGEIYPCKPDIFEATYECAEESSA